MITTLDNPPTPFLSRMYSHWRSGREARISHARDGFLVETRESHESYLPCL